MTYAAALFMSYMGPESLIKLLKDICPALRCWSETLVSIEPPWGMFNRLFSPEYEKYFSARAA